MFFEVRDGEFEYQKNRNVFHGVNLCCQEGEAVAVLGPNGAGKTTFLRCVCGFLRWKHGAAFLDGEEVSKLSPNMFWKQVGYVPQHYGGGLGMNTEDMILLGRNQEKGLFSQPSKKDKLAAEQCMELLGISHLRGKTCSQISQGELQLVRIGRAVVSNPKFLILDEPESGLDLKNTHDFLQLMKKLKKEQRIAFLWNTHFPANAWQFADYVLLFDGKGNSRFGTKRDMLEQETLEWAFGTALITEVFQKDGTEFLEVFPTGEEKRK